MSPRRVCKLCRRRGRWRFVASPYGGWKCADPERCADRQYLRGMMVFDSPAPKVSREPPR